MVNGDSMLKRTPERIALLLPLFLAVFSTCMPSPDDAPFPCMCTLSPWNIMSVDASMYWCGSMQVDQFS